jgi:hypothetical protein
VSLDAALEATEDVGSARSESVTVLKWDGDTTTTREVGVHDYRNDRSETVWIFGERRSTTILVGETSYAEITADESDPITRGKRWVRHPPLTERRFEDLNKDRCEEESGINGEGFCASMVFVGESIDRDDPATLLELANEYGSGERVIGKEEVRGTPTTHFRTLVDFRRASEDAYREQGWSNENIRLAVQGQPREPAQVDFWIDDDGVVRRVRTIQNHDMAEDFPEDLSEGPEDLGSSTWTVTTEYFDFGVEVDIQEPPASEVIDVNEVWDANRRLPPPVVPGQAAWGEPSPPSSTP